MAGTHSLGIPPENRGVVLSERSESKGDGRGAPGLRGVHKSGLCDISSHDLESQEGIIEALG